jgi:hypothetical protein
MAKRWWSVGDGPLGEAGWAGTYGACAPDAGEVPAARLRVDVITFALPRTLNTWETQLEAPQLDTPQNREGAFDQMPPTVKA